jgi:ubiquitin C-terminal hydrolase
MDISYDQQNTNVSSKYTYSSLSETQNLFEDYMFYDHQYVMPPMSLNNMGSICWFNSLLQSLFSLSAFNQRMIELDDEQHFEDNKLAKKYIEYLRKYLPIFNKKVSQINEPTISVKILKDFYDELVKNKIKLNINDQEGATNGLILFFQMINSKLIDEVMFCKSEQTVKCQHCNKLTSFYEDFSPLINIYVNRTFNDQEDFRKYLKLNAEPIDEYNCEKCGKKSKFTAQTPLFRSYELKRIREVMIITFRKYTARRFYPQELAFLSNERKMLRFKLVSEIIHNGMYNPNSHQSSGHYWNNSLRYDNNINWYQQNDSNVNKLNTAPAPTNQTHIIFYHLYDHNELTPQEKLQYKQILEKN